MISEDGVDGFTLSNISVNVMKESMKMKLSVASRVHLAINGLNGVQDSTGLQTLETSDFQATADLPLYTKV